MEAFKRRSATEARAYLPKHQASELRLIEIQVNEVVVTLDKVDQVVAHLSVLLLKEFVNNFDIGVVFEVVLCAFFICFFVHFSLLS